jgi:hypothetical protein
MFMKLLELFVHYGVTSEEWKVCSEEVKMAVVWDVAPFSLVDTD